MTPAEFPLEPVLLELPPPHVSIPYDDHDPERWDERREGLWTIADMADGKMLVIDSPEPGLVQ